MTWSFNNEDDVGSDDGDEDDDVTQCVFGSRLIYALRSILEDIICCDQGTTRISMYANETTEYYCV